MDITIKIEKLANFSNGGGRRMSEEIRSDFMESVRSLVLLWCNRTITTEELLRFFNQTVAIAEQRAKADPASWGNMI